MINPACLDDGEFEVFVFCPVDGVVPQVRRGAEPEQFYRVLGHATLLQIVARELAGGLVGEGSFASVARSGRGFAAVDP